VDKFFFVTILRELQAWHELVSSLVSL